MAYEDLLKKCAAFERLARSSNEYMREYMRNRYHSKRHKAIQELGGKCSRCGSTKDLQFDHKDQSKKKIRMSDIHSINDKAVKDEMKNVQLLCIKCHDKKSHDAWDFATNKPQHGTYWMYRKHECRCSKCEKAYRETQKEWRKKK